MNKLTVGLVFVGLITGFAILVTGKEKAEENGVELEWMTDFEAAKELAEEEDKLILADFSGSDWCPPCMMLEEKVFSQPEFSKFAEKEVILLLVDFPRQKEQPEEVKKQNEKLAQRYGIKGLPTVLLLNHEGKVQARTTGYQRGGAEKYVKKLKELLKEQE